MKNICRTEKRWLFLLIVIHVGRNKLCIGGEAHRRGVEKRMEMVHRE
jgi:hypothetical protein